MNRDVRGGNGPEVIACMLVARDLEYRLFVVNYPGVPGTSLPRVSGAQWTLAMEWNDSDTGLGWQPSNIRRVAEGTVREGLVVRLGADDRTTYVARDLDFDDLVLVCVCLDPAVNPFPPGPPPFDFSVPKDVLIDTPAQKPDVPNQEPDIPNEPNAPTQNATIKGSYDKLRSGE